MPRGSRPGERRGGRQRGTPNKMLASIASAIAGLRPTLGPSVAAALERHMEQNVVLLGGLDREIEAIPSGMRDPQVPLDLRLEIAAAVAPFLHPRPEPARKKRPDPIDLRDRLVDTGDLKFQRLEAKPAAEGGGAGDLSPLDFLLGVMNDPAATPRQRVKAAGVAARYTHAHAGGAEAPTMIVLEDKFGFKVDPELARAERDDRLRESSLGVPKKGSAEAGAIEKELEEIRKRRAERVALVTFPASYTYGDREADQKRLQQLYSKRLSRKKLTPEEDAEEAHLAVRVLNPVKPPKMKIPFELEGPKGRIYELEKRRVGEILRLFRECERPDIRGCVSPPQSVRPHSSVCQP